VRHSRKKNNGNNGGGVFSSGRKREFGAQQGIETPRVRKEPMEDWKNKLANLWSGKKITKRPALVLGKKPMGNAKFSV
jgi:hypothetical protein